MFRLRLLQRDPAFLVGLKTAAQYGGETQCNDYPVGGAARPRPLDRFGQHGGASRHSHQEPLGSGDHRGGCRGGTGRIRAFDNRLETERVQGGQHGGQCLRRVAEREPALEKVEVQRGDARDYGELAANQRFLGRAIHLVDAQHRLVVRGERGRKGIRGNSVFAFAG